MTVKTKKVLVALLLCLLIAATVTLGVFCFIPNFYINDSDYFQSAFTAIQKSRAFTDTVKASYTLKLDEENEQATAENVVSSIKTRLTKIYGYYGSSVTYNEQDNLLTIEIPVSNNTNTQAKPSAQTILSNVIVDGKVEILNTQFNSGNYSADSVLLTEEHFSSASVRSYLNQGVTFYICRVSLTDAGEELAETLSENTPYSCYIDQNLETWVYWTGSEIQITYAQNDPSVSQEHAKATAAYINSGALNATLSQEGSTVTVENKLGWIYILVLGLVILASWVFFAVRYKTVGLIPIFTQLLAVFVFIFFGALVHLEIFNVAMGVGVILAYVFMTVFSALSFEKMRKLMVEGGKNYAVARYQALSFSRDNRKPLLIALIAHGVLLVLGIILWVIPTLVTAPLGNALVYGAVLSLIVTFGLNRLFALLVAPYYEGKGVKTQSKK